MNNSFTHCIDQICGLEISTLATYKYTLFGGNTVVVEGHKGICNYQSDQIAFAVKGATLTIFGNGLRLKCLDKRFAVIVGDVSRVEVSK